MAGGPEPGAGDGQAAAVRAEVAPCPASPGQRLLDAVNGERRRHGLTTLAPHPELVAAARIHADDMAAAGEIFHVGTDGTAAPDRIQRAGYGWLATGENVAGGYAAADSVLAAWLESPTHRAVVLDPLAVHAGVGFTISSAAGARWYWVLNVAAPARAETTPAVRCHP